MHILALMGSGRKKGNTFRAVQSIEQKLKTLDADLSFEYLYLADVDISACSGCRVCFDKGEVSCPHKDSVSLIATRLLAADGVIFASPTYVCTMSGSLKNLLDRLAYFCHRPAFHGKTALVITTTATAGARLAAYTVRLPLGSMGFTVAGSLGITLNTGNVVSVPEKAVKRLDKLAVKFYQKAAGKKRNAPTVFSLVSFYMNREHYHKQPTLDSCDYRYFKSKGWLEPDRKYYTDEKPSLPKVIVARFITFFMHST